MNNVNAYETAFPQHDTSTLKKSLLQFAITIHVYLLCNFFFFFRNDILTEELECQLTASVTAKKEDDSDSDLDID